MLPPFHLPDGAVDGVLEPPGRPAKQAGAERVEPPPFHQFPGFRAEQGEVGQPVQAGLAVLVVGGYQDLIAVFGGNIAGQRIGLEPLRVSLDDAQIAGVEHASIDHETMTGVKRVLLFRNRTGKPERRNALRDVHRITPRKPISLCRSVNRSLPRKNVISSSAIEVHAPPRMTTAVSSAVAHSGRGRAEMAGCMRSRVK